MSVTLAQSVEDTGWASRHTCNGIGRWEHPADQALPHRYYAAFPRR